MGKLIISDIPLQPNEEHRIELAATNQKKTKQFNIRVHWTGQRKVLSVLSSISPRTLGGSPYET